jgi:hypothetical protein
MVSRFQLPAPEQKEPSRLLVVTSSGRVFLLIPRLEPGGTPSPVFLQMFILKSFKSCVLKLRIPKGLGVCFAEVRILKGIGQKQLKVEGLKLR